MTRKLLTAAATALAGLVLGAGIGVAAAGDDPVPAPTTPGGVGWMDVESMDEMHAAMRDLMPADLAATCDAMHAAMPEGVGTMSPGAMSSMMGTLGGDMAERHAEHHR